MKYVTFLDILGFKDLIENNSLESILKIYKESIEKSYQLVIVGYANFEELNDPNVRIKIKIISDSIILWTEDAEHNSFVKPCVLTSALAYTLFRLGMPLRGALTIGELEELKLNENTSDETIVLLGSGLSNAYILEGQQQWAGCIISDEAIQYFSNLDTKEGERITVEDLLKARTLIKYNIPLKTATSHEYYALNWAEYFPEKPSPNYIRKKFKDYNKNTENESVENKIVNTINYLQYSYNTARKDI